MRLMLLFLVMFLIVSDALSLDLSLGPGLSAKNALLYLVVVMMVCRMVLGGMQVQRGARALQLTFAVLLGYALLTWATVGFVLKSPDYDAVDAAISLKSSLIDQLLFFLVFFHGVHSEQEARSTLTGMLLAVVFANLVTVFDVLGIIELGITEERSDGRVTGTIGESNQYGAFIALFLPAVLAAMATARGPARLLWIGAALVCAAALVMTVSRGAFVGLALAAAIGVYAFRRILSAPRLVAWAGAAMLMGTLVISALWVRFGDLLVERVGGASGGDMADVSSGRTQIWAAAVERMLDSPITLLTGYGWDMYWTMPFRYAPHNHYLGLWFNLGLPGLLCGVLLLVLAIRLAKRTVDRAPDELRPQLIAYVFGGTALALAVFFVDLYRPWWYFWAYTGLVMRIAVSVTEQVEEPAATSAPSTIAGVRGAYAPRDAYGWIAARR